MPPRRNSFIRPMAGLAFLALLGHPSLLQAQTSQTTQAVSTTGTFEGVAIGAPMASLRASLGDPIKIERTGETVIWRYLTHGGATFLDIIVKNNVVQSLTLLNRFNDLKYVDPNGIAFGETPDQVRAKLGSTTREATNSDDGSLDLWYTSLPYAWVYEFRANSLSFIQLVASPKFLATFSAGSPATGGDGTSLDRAIWIRPSHLLFTSTWIGIFLDKTTCGTNGHWVQTASRFQAESQNPLAYTIVSASCSDGNAKRDFYFNTSGSTQPTSGNDTIYIDPSQLRQMIQSPSPSAPPSPAPRFRP
jgi:hypothetical protein